MTPEQLAALQARLVEQDMLALSEAEAAGALNVAGSGTGATWQDVPTAAVYRRLLIDAAPGAAGVVASVTVAAAALPGRPERNDRLTYAGTDYLAAEVLQDARGVSWRLHLRRA